MKKTSSVAFAAALVACGAAHAQSIEQLWASAQPLSAATTGPTLSVERGGSAPIETALATIIPPPYRIELDARVPTAMVLEWAGGNDWMRVLQNAISPVGLVARPDWSTNTILITLRNQPVRVAAPGQALAMPAASSADSAIATPVASASSPMQTTDLPGDPVMGATDPGWNQPAPDMPNGPVTLASAVMRLTPTSMVGARLEINGVNDAEKVEWHKGQTRIEALRSILLSRGLHAAISGQRITIKPNAAVSAKASPRQAHDRSIAAAPVPAVQRWNIATGQSISSALKDWAKRAGWSVVWNLQDDWTAPNATAFSGDFVDAASSAIKALAGNGADIRGTFYQANRTLVVSTRGSQE